LVRKSKEINFNPKDLEYFKKVLRLPENLDINLIIRAAKLDLNAYEI
jgi:hypothetical protein